MLRPENTAARLSALRALDENSYPYGLADDGTSVMAKCCTMYPLETGEEGELLLSRRDGANTTVSIAMHGYMFGQFYERMWPNLHKHHVSFTLVTAMQDNALPWEVFKCVLHRNGTSMRKFIRSRLLRHWYHDDGTRTHMGASVESLFS